MSQGALGRKLHPATGRSFWTLLALDRTIGHIAHSAVFYPDRSYLRLQVQHDNSDPTFPDPNRRGGNEHFSRPLFRIR